MDDEYASEITQIAVARACVALGFKQCDKGVVDSLADIVQHYIKTLGSNAQEQAELCGRAHAGIHDLLLVLDTTVSVLLQSTIIRLC
jgi:histone H3/H4